MTKDQKIKFEALKYAASLGHSISMLQEISAPFTLKEAQAQPPMPKRPWSPITEQERASFDAANPKTKKEWNELFNSIDAKR